MDIVYLDNAATTFPNPMQLERKSDGVSMTMPLTREAQTLW